MIRRGLAVALIALLSMAPHVGNASPPAGRRLGSVSVIQREPTAFDDMTRGYAVGNLWQAPSGLFVAQRVAAGQAVWTRSVVSGDPIDAVGGEAPIAAYGTRRLTAAYAGKAFNVVRGADGGAADIGFLPTDGLDAATLDAFCAGTTCTVDIWYDQSGHRNNATQTIAANQPSVSPASLGGNARSVVFDSQLDQSPYSIKYMILPSGVAAAGNNVSVFVLGRAYSSERPSIYTQLTNPTYPQVLSSALVNGNPDGSPHSLYFTYGSALRGPVAGLSQTWSLVGYICSSAGSFVYLDEAVTSYGAQANQALAGGYLGTSTAAIARYSGYNEQTAVLIYPRGLSTTTEVASLRQSLAASFRIYPQIRDVVVVDGDSITEGYGSTLLQNRTRQLIALLEAPALVVNKGFYGDTLAHRVVNYPADIAPMVGSAANRNVLEIFAGTNDNTGADPTGDLLYANITAYVAAAHATGFKVLVGTMLPRNGWHADRIGEQLAFNARVRGNAAAADGIIDYAADPMMGVQANTADKTYYLDGTHPTTTGYGRLARIEAAAFNQMMKQ